MYLINKKKEPKLISDRISDSTIYFSISNFLDNDYNLTITRIIVKEEELNKHIGESVYTNRYQLKTVYLTNSDIKHDLLDKITLKLPPNDASSFYFEYHHFKKGKNLCVLSLMVYYIDPNTGEVKYMETEFLKPIDIPSFTNEILKIFNR